MVNVKKEETPGLLAGNSCSCLGSLPTQRSTAMNSGTSLNKITNKNVCIPFSSSDTSYTLFFLNAVHLIFLKKIILISQSASWRIFQIQYF